MTRVDFGTSRLFSNIEIAANGTNMQAQRMAIEASDDGTNFRLVKQLVPPRQGWQNYDYNTTFAFTPTKARYWRLSWTPEGTEPGSEDLDAAKWRPRLGLKNAIFHSQPRIDNWEGKAGYVWDKLCPSVHGNPVHHIPYRAYRPYFYRLYQRHSRRCQGIGVRQVLP